MTTRQSWMRHGARVASVAGVPIVIHPSWVCSVGILGAFVTGPVATRTLGGGPLAVLVAVVSVLPIAASIVVHELAHAVTARTLGLVVDRITLFAFGGVSVIGGRSASPNAEAAIALAGPSVSIVIASILAAISTTLSPAGGQATLLEVYAFVNLLLAVFNLVPAFPMDGGRVLRAILWRLAGDRARATAWAANVGRVLAGAVVVLGLYALLAPLARDATPDLGGVWTAALGAFIYLSAAEAERIEGGPDAADDGDPDRAVAGDGDPDRAAAGDGDPDRAAAGDGSRG